MAGLVREYFFAVTTVSGSRLPGAGFGSAAVAASVEMEEMRMNADLDFMDEEAEFGIEWWCVRKVFQRRAAEPSRSMNITTNVRRGGRFPGARDGLWPPSAENHAHPDVQTQRVPGVDESAGKPEQ